MVALVDVSHLDTDLSGFKLIQNTRYGEMQRFLGEAIDKLLAECEARTTEIPFGIPQRVV